MELNLTKPVVFFDLETTGTSVTNDRIVEICLLKVFPDGREQEKTYRVNPGIPIPPAATAVHHITDDDVRDKPTFPQIAREVEAFFEGCDIAGFNSNRFDVPMLAEEFLRAGIDVDFSKPRFIDVQVIYHKMEQRTLSAAYKFYCGKNLDDAHSATGDTRATYEVLKAQLDRYEGVEYTSPTGAVSVPVVNDVPALSQFTANTQWADLVGHIGYDKMHREIFNFGKYKGKTLEEVFGMEPAYYDWMMKADFPLSTKALINEVWKRMRDKKLNDLKLHFGG